jgi:2-polyprenyl-6-methoxyphenol hydroxylase-like FAD-dependent oxidoreductase
MSGLKVLVVGASIAGPTTAYWLAKAGAKVTIIERFPHLRTGGQAVDIRTAGVSVMRKMPGMEARVRAKSTREEGVCFVREDGRPYGTIRATGNSDRQSLVSEYEIFRGDLAKVLFDLTKDNENITYVFGEQIASMQQSKADDGPVTVKFAHGSRASTYDLVVGCDGATSKTRAMGFGCGVRDHIVPTNCWAAYFSIKPDLLHGSTISQGYSAPGGRFISVTSDPSGHSRLMLMSIHPRNQPNATLPFRRASKQGAAALKNYIAQHYRNAGWITASAMQEMLHSARDFYAAEVVQVKPPRLHSARTVLVGDAGYASGPAGSGTSLAFAGAYLLAGELCRHGGDVAAGLRGYEQRMRPIVTELQKIPPLVPAILAPQTVWGIGVRNWAFAVVAWTGVAEAVQTWFGGAFAATERFPLPEYEWGCLRRWRETGSAPWYL